MRSRVAGVFALALCLVPMAGRAVPLVGSLDAALTWSPGSPRVNETATFTAWASDGDGMVTQARICFGDGSSCRTEVRSPSTAEQIIACVFGDNWGPQQWTHRFTVRGTYTVSLTVTSRGCPGVPDETKTIQQNITVRI